MISNYLKVIFRNLKKHKLFGITNIAGLSIGILCCLMIMIYVNHELSYDKWNPNADRIVRTYSDINFGGNLMKMAVSGSVIAPESADALPEIEAWCRIRDYGSYLTKIDGTDQMNIEVEEALHADSTFFKLFPSKLLEGDPERCLAEPNKVVLSESLAEILLDAEDPLVGQILLLDNRNRWQVSGIFEDFPKNTHFEVDMVLSLHSNQEIAESPPFWAANNNFHTYFLLRERTDQQTFARKFENLSREKTGITSSTLLGMTLAEFEATGQYARFGLQPLTDIHLRSDLSIELKPGGDIRYIWIFTSVALFVLLIACINFMNLSTAKSTRRGEEIAVRKVLGSSRSQLIFQFLGEAVIMTSLAVALALVAGRLALPWFNKLVEVPLDLPWNNSNFWLAILAATMIVSLIAGSYPAFFLSGFHPAQTLKNHIHNNRQSGYIRSGLVTFQFLIAIVLIIGTLLIYQQLRYIQSKELGFQKEQIIVLNDAFTLNENISAFKESMMQSPLIEAASVSSYLPTPSSRSNSTYSKVRELRQDQLINMAEWYVDHDYLSTFELEMKEGRFFSRDFPGDSTAVIVNETAAAIIGYEHPIGEKIYGLAGNPDGAPKPEDFDEFTIIGVVKDFHFESLKENIGSLAFFLGQANGLISFRFQPEETGQVVSLLESNWRRMAPDQPFSYRFVDEEFDRIYEAEQRIGKISLIFAILAIIVSCLGLFGLSTFVVEQRMKEIGIRKILGSSASGIVRLLAGSFIQLVLLAFVLAIPVTIYLMKQWLQNFAYRIDIHWSVFVYAGLTAIMIAFATICFQSIRAAVANPVNALRSD